MKAHGYATTELAMRQFLYVQQHAHGESWTKDELAMALRDKFHVSRATAYRAVSLALEVLCRHYEMNATRTAKARDKHSATLMARTA